PVWKFSVAEIDGSNPVTKEITVGGNYDNRHFVYYNFETDQVIDREPNREDWDLLFTKYTEDLGVMMYGVFGVLTSERIGVAKVTSEQIDTVTWDEQPLDSAINVIGRGWKSAGATVTVFDTITYFISVANNDVWQLEFTYGTTGSNDGIAA